MSEQHEGGCYCAQVRFVIEGPFEGSGICHCDNCRKAVGGQSVAWLTVKKDNFKVTKGELTQYRTDTKAWRSFCPKCGCSVSFKSDGRPGEIDITTGSMDHPELFPPDSDYFVDERLPWIERVGKDED